MNKTEQNIILFLFAASGVYFGVKYIRQQNKFKLAKKPTAPAIDKNSVLKTLFPGVNTLPDFNWNSNETEDNPASGTKNGYIWQPPTANAGTDN